MSSTACWSSDARFPSASPDHKRGRGNCARTPGSCNTAVHDAGAAPILHHPFEQSLGGVGLARPGGAHDGQALVQRGDGQHARDPVRGSRFLPRLPTRRRPQSARPAGSQQTADRGFADVVAPGHVGGGASARQDLLCRFQKTTSVVTRRALQHSAIGMFIADRATSIASQGGFRGPGAALAGDSDDLGRATESPANRQNANLNAIKAVIARDAFSWVAFVRGLVEAAGMTAESHL